MDKVTIGMAGAGRATELHIMALKRFSGVPVRLKTIVARRKEQLEEAQRLYGFEQISYSFEDMLNDPEIDVIDICTPPYAHGEMIEKAMVAGKHVICEKPLTGYFGTPGDEEPIGDNVSKRVMYLKMLEQIRQLRTVIKKTGKKFCFFVFIREGIHGPCACGFLF